MSFTDWFKNTNTGPQQQAAPTRSTRVAYGGFTDWFRAANTSQNPPQKESNDQFWNRIYNSAKANGAVFPELVAAQAALESGWGKRESGRNNLFGQKASANQAGTMRQTKEDINGRVVQMQQRFRDYNSLDESLQDHISKWQPKYSMARDARTAAELLQSGDRRYATDSGYVKKLHQILASKGY